MRVNDLIYFYIFMCVSLLLFNISYILRSKNREELQRRRVRHWEKQLQKAAEATSDAGVIPHATRRMLVAKLVNIYDLMAFMSAAEPKLQDPQVRQLLDGFYPVFVDLGKVYGKMPPMERAFFAYVVSMCRPVNPKEGDQLGEILLEMLDDSTVYCRENVLQALYAMGNPNTVEKALSRLDSNGWYHHPNLLSDGLASFQGDREALARQLWAKCQSWNEFTQAGIVRFAASITDSMQEPFLEALQDKSTQNETMFALVRYFQRRPCDKALPKLCELARSGANGGPAIAACAALANYPCKASVEALKVALCSRNWYIRKNAARSLVSLNVPMAQLRELAANDRYAREMLEYVSGGQTTGEVTV